MTSRMAAHNFEEIWGSANDEMDTMQMERVTNPNEMFTEDTNWRSIESDGDDHSSLGDPYFGPRSPIGMNFTRAKTGRADNYGVSILSSGYRQQSPISTFNSPASLMTASSRATFISARTTYNSSAYMSASSYSPAMRIETIREDEPPGPGLSAPLVQLHKDYYCSLRQQEIIQPFDKELNWSGKGQHVTFSATDVIPLSHISHLGSSNSASVDRVLCRRVALARKTMRCDRKWTVIDALREVYHLQNLRHFHIVQLVGTYLQGRDFSILMYPAADMHLGRFLEDTIDMSMQTSMERRIFLSSTLGCLTSAVSFIHQHTTKHMDIKPQNMLVREANSSGSWRKWRVYIADFGLSRSFASQDHSQTDGPTSRTPRYCAPEVYNYEQRGRSADIFSLGCVFLEILTVICCIDLHVFTDARRGDGDDESFHANLDRTIKWAFQNLCPSFIDLGEVKWAVTDELGLKIVTELVITMIAQEPEKRPTAAEVHTRLENPDSIIWLYSSGNRGPLRTPFSRAGCCLGPQEPYEAYQPPSGTASGNADMFTL
jgi:serine/threonine protein kinase